MPIKTYKLVKIFYFNIKTEEYKKIFSPTILTLRRVMAKAENGSYCFTMVLQIVDFSVIKPSIEILIKMYNEMSS